MEFWHWYFIVKFCRTKLVHDNLLLSVSKTRKRIHWEVTGCRTRNLVKLAQVKRKEYKGIAKTKQNKNKKYNCTLQKMRNLQFFFSIVCAGQLHSLLGDFSLVGAPSCSHQLESRVSRKDTNVYWDHVLNTVPNTYEYYFSYLQKLPYRASILTDDQWRSWKTDPSDSTAGVLKCKIRLPANR